MSPWIQAWTRHVNQLRKETQMNSSEIYDAIRTGRKEDVQQALFELLSVTQSLSTAVLELAGTAKLKLGSDPLSSRSRLHLTEFLGLPKERA